MTEQEGAVTGPATSLPYGVEHLVSKVIPAEHDDALAEASILLETALFLRTLGERPPGAPGDPDAETWADWERRCEAFLRAFPPADEPTVLCSMVVGPGATVIAKSEGPPSRIRIDITCPEGMFFPDDAITLDLVRRP